MSVILIGKNSNLYLNYKSLFDSFVDIALGFKDVDKYPFNPNDSLIILSYGKSKSALDLFAHNLSELSIKKFLLVSTCTTIVTEKTKCYTYPAIKQYQEKLFVEKLDNISILSVGTIVNDSNIKDHQGTCITKDKDFFRVCRDKILSDHTQKYSLEFEVAKFSNRSSVEYKIYRLYKKIIKLLPIPCLLRPLDILFKFIGWKWYGYGVLTTILLEKKHDSRV